MKNKLTSKRVQETFEKCLLKDNEDSNKSILADGIMARTAFNSERLGNFAKDIEEMLSELPEQFMADTGGGWSFLNACEDKHGNQWTGEHRVMDQLLTLGIAIGKAKIMLPRALWSAFPGGLPYFQVNI